MLKAILALLFIAGTPLLLSAQQPVKGKVTLKTTANDITALIGDNECDVAWVQFYVGANPVGPHITTATAGSYQYLWDSATVVNGQYSVTARATDKAGLNGACDSTKQNTSQPSTPATLITVANIPDDVTPPTVTIVIIAANGGVVTKKVQIQASAVDQSPITQMQVLINNAVQRTWQNVPGFNYEWNSSPYKGQSVSISARARDTAGNEGMAQAVVRVQ